MKENASFWQWKNKAKTKPNKPNLVPSAVEGSIKTTIYWWRIQKEYLLVADMLPIKRNGVVLLPNDSAIFSRTGEFSERPILETSKSGGFSLLLCFILGYERPAQYHFLKQDNTCKGYANNRRKKPKDETLFLTICKIEGYT